MYVFVYFSSSIKSFSSKTSSSNMMSHLKSDHNTTEGSIATNSTRNIQSFFSVKPRNDLASTESERKRKLVIDIVLLCCKDLLPFSITDGIGLTDFCMVSFSCAVIIYYFWYVGFQLS